MTVEVVKKFIDRHTKAVHNVGETFEVTEERFTEICKAGAFVRAVSDQTEPETETEAEPETTTETETKPETTTKTKRGKKGAE